VLQRRGLTAARLEQAARALAADPERANKVFQAISRKVAGAPATRPPGEMLRRGTAASDSADARVTRRRLRSAKGGRSPTR
jgi:hypothetical protein